MSSLKEFLKQYPSFLDKTENSNFYKHVEIYNKQRLELLQQLNNIQLSRNIERPIQIQKSQNTHNTAVYYFYIYLEDIKSVKIIREDTNEVIKEKQYNEKGHSKVFFRYQVYSKDVIPNPRFHVIVETYNEYTYEKGYPENDILMGNIYDHDTNLDMLGKILGVSRYNHITVNESEYPYTIPPYFNKATEDDYYYQERIKTYISRFAYYYDISNIQYDALPLLEFWKYYGFNPLMKNRKILLSSQEGVKDINDWTSYDDGDDTFYSPVNGTVSSVYDISVDPLSSVRYQIQSILNMDKLEKAEPVELNLDIHVDTVSCRLGDSVTVTGVVTDVDGNPMYGIPVDLYVNGTVINKDITNNQGVYTFTYNPTNTGEIVLYTTVSSSDTYNSSVSSTITVTVINTVLYQPTLNGTEEITQISGTTTVSGGEIYGGVGFLKEGWDNSSNWKLTCKYKAQYGTSMWVMPTTETQMENNGLQLKNYNDHEYSVFVNGATTTKSADTNCYPNDTYVPVTIVKDGTTFTLTINGYTYTATWDTSSFSSLCIGIQDWESGKTSYVKEIKVVQL